MRLKDAASAKPHRAAIAFTDGLATPDPAGRAGSAPAVAAGSSRPHPEAPLDEGVDAGAKCLLAGGSRGRRQSAPLPEHREASRCRIGGLAESASSLPADRAQCHWRRVHSDCPPVHPDADHEGSSAIHVEIADTEALAALPELEACVNSRPVPGWLKPPVRLGDTEERVKPQVLYAADLRSVSEDDQRP